MRTKTTKIHLLSLLTAAFLFPFANAMPALALDNTIYLSPATQTVTKGNTFTVAVGVSTSSNVTEVETNLSYPSSLLMFQDVSYSGSAFATQVSWSGGGGSIRIGRSTAGGVSGDLPVAVLTFKVMASSGTGTISVLNSSWLKNDGTSVNTQYGSAVVDFGTVPAPSQPATVQPAPITTFKKLASLTDASSYDITPPQMSNVRSEQTGANTQTIAWTTNEPSNSKVEYGLNTQYGLTVNNDAMVTNHSVVLRSAFLLPNSLFHYRVTSVDPNGNKVYSMDFVFTTKNVAYSIVVLGSDGKPLPHAMVTLNGQIAYTDSHGKASLGSGAGKQSLTIDYRDTILTRNVTIAADKLQQLDTVTISAKSSLIDGRYILYPFMVLMGLFLGLASRAYLLRYPLAILRRGKKRFLTMPISMMQLEYGDKNPAHNPYQIKRLFGFWAIENFFVRFFQRPGVTVSRKVRDEVVRGRSVRK